MHSNRHTWRRLSLLATTGIAVVALAACSSSNGSSNNSTTPTGGGSTAKQDNVSVTLGYFPNLTHGSAIVGVQEGYFTNALKTNGATLVPQIFNSGSDTLTALLGGSLDATYIGPAPAVSAFVTSHGSAVRVISGAATGGASLVVKSDIKSIADLKGKTIADPGSGNTQDIALRYFLKQHGFNETSSGGGDVKILSQDNGLTLTAFASGQIDGAWVPEPYASELVAKGGVRLVNEKSLWPNGKFTTTVLLVRTDFAQKYPELVTDLLTGQVQANEFIQQHSSQAEQIVGNWLAGYTQSAIPQNVLDAAWSELTFTDDPAADTLVEVAKHAAAVGVYPTTPDVKSIFDLDPLNKVLKADHQPTVAGPSVQ